MFYYWIRSKYSPMYGMCVCTYQVLMYPYKNHRHLWAAWVKLGALLLCEKPWEDFMQLVSKSFSQGLEAVGKRLHLLLKTGSAFLQ